MLSNKQGFTLVELVIVIVIIGILAAIAIPKFADLSDSAKVAACKQNQEAVESACTIYYANSAMAGTPEYPDDFDDIDGDGGGDVLYDGTQNCALTPANSLDISAGDGTCTCDTGC